MTTLHCDHCMNLHSIGLLASIYQDVLYTRAVVWLVHEPTCAVNTSIFYFNGFMV